jgi:hypothetical protein
VFDFSFYSNLAKKEHLKNAKLDNIFTFPILEYALTPCFLVLNCTNKKIKKFTTMRPKKKSSR